MYGSFVKATVDIVKKIFMVEKEHCMDWGLVSSPVVFDNSMQVEERMP
jgi:hypothetical protein